MSYSKTAKYSSFLYGSDQEVARKIQLISTLTSSGTESILEIGAGHGSLAMALCRKGFTVTALEESDAFFAIMLDRFNREKELRSLFTPIPKSLKAYTEPRLFDLAIATKFLSHFQPSEWLEVFASARGLLKSSGILVFDCAQISRLRVNQPWQEIQKRIFGHTTLHHHARSHKVSGSSSMQVDYKFIMRRNGEILSEEEESHVLYLANAEQVMFDLRRAGFNSIKKYSGWTMEPSEPDDPSLLFIAHVQ